MVNACFLFLFQNSDKKVIIMIYLYVPNPHSEAATGKGCCFFRGYDYVKAHTH